MKTLDSTTRVTFKNILFATDLSPSAEKALPYAVEIAHRYHAAVYAVHVIRPDVYPLVLPAAWAKFAEYEGEFRRESRLHLDEQLRDLSHEIIFQAGDTWPTLAEVIEEKLVDLLVLGTHGRTGLEKVLLGSVAEEIFRQALCPVLTVGPHSSLRPKNAAELNRILYATDFSPESLAAALIAISLAREHRAQLILLHSMEGTGEVSVLRHALRDLVPFGADLRCQLECVVERGAPANKKSGSFRRARSGHYRPWRARRRRSPRPNYAFRSLGRIQDRNASQVPRIDGARLTGQSSPDDFLNHSASGAPKPSLLPRLNIATTPPASSFAILFPRSVGPWIRPPTQASEVRWKHFLRLERAGSFSIPVDQDEWTITTEDRTHPDFFRKPL
jgi:nucleotide-binding universal stress UspA family protein